MLSNNSFGFISQGTSGGGGGGTIFTDGLTIDGDGSGIDPIYETSALLGVYHDGSSQTYNVVGGGKVYYISGSDNTFVFNNTNILPNQVVRVVNLCDDYLIINAIGTSVYYQATTISVTNIPFGMVYDFVYDNYLNYWYCLAPTPIPTFLHDFVAQGDLEIFQSGFYRLINADDGSYLVTLPDPSKYKGQTIYLFNQNSLLSSTIGFVAPFFPYQPDGSDYYSLGAYSCYELFSNGSQWTTINQYNTP